MLRPATARLLTVTPVLNSAPNWLPHPTGQVALGLAIVESPASQTVGPAAATVAVEPGALAAAVAQAGSAAAADAPTSNGTRSAVAASQRIMIASAKSRSAAGRRHGWPSMYQESAYRVEARSANIPPCGSLSTAYRPIGRSAG